MEAGTQQRQSGKAPGGLEGAPDDLELAAGGKDVGDAGEKRVLDYLLGKTFRPKHFVDIKLETEAGLLPLRVFLRALDETKFDEIDAANREGEGPFSKLDVGGFNAGVLAEAIESFGDPNDPEGPRVKPDDAEFRGQVPNVETAIAGRFKYQPGLTNGLVDEVRKISAYAPDRVGTAQRIIQSAVGNSLGAGD